MNEEEKIESVGRKCRLPLGAGMTTTQMFQKAMVMFALDADTDIESLASRYDQLAQEAFKRKQLEAEEQKKHQEEVIEKFKEDSMEELSKLVEKQVCRGCGKRLSEVVHSHIIINLIRLYDGDILRSTDNSKTLKDLVNRWFGNEMEKRVFGLSCKKCSATVSLTIRRIV